MIRWTCGCGQSIVVSESSAGQQMTCGVCGRIVQLACGEKLPEGAGEADFDARLVIERAPERVGEHILLGGVSEISIGKTHDNHVVFTGNMVSRHHARLVRVDFGPSRWEICDNNSTNGIYVNGRRIARHELQDGDNLVIGECLLRFGNSASPTASGEAGAAAWDGHSPRPVLPVSGGITCPSCGKVYAASAQICVPCGIYLDSGRALVTSKGFDEDEMAERTEAYVKVWSWFTGLGLVPVASEAFATRKPRASWAWLAITVLISLGFLIARAKLGQTDPRIGGLYLWGGAREPVVAKLAEARALLKKAQGLDGGALAGDPYVAARISRVIKSLEEAIRQLEFCAGAQFHSFQLLTYLFLHDGLLHLVGNLIFLVVFGVRVNELIGNARTAIIYPVLGIAAALVDLYAMRHAPMHPTLGASGAIMGLAGMYLVFFPVQKVRMAIYLWLGPLTGWYTFYKVFAVRGWWLLFFWVTWNDLVPTMWTWLRGRSEMSGGVAHWAHLGGFAAGVLIALGLLVTRQVHARGADILSVALGRRAWALIGKPAGRLDAPQLAPARAI
jgi:membrane associated rhomboid family serine protease